MSQQILRFTIPQELPDISDPAISQFEAFRTQWGILYQGNCLEILPSVKDATVDTVFADPPFNLAKEYDGKVNDKLSAPDYVLCV